MKDIELAELVTKLLNEHPEDDIYLGSKSAFFFIGTPAELLLNLQDLNDRYFNYFKDGLEKSDKKILELLNTCPDSDIVKKKGKLEVRITYHDAYRQWKGELAVALKESCHFDDCIERFEPMASRKVRDFRFRQNKNEGRIIVVTGDETGNYWMKSDLNKNIPFWDEDDEEGGESMDGVKLFRKGNVYKIAWFSNRIDAKRHLYAAFQAVSDGEAIETFTDVVTTLLLKEENQNKTFKLYSGDWKREIYSFEK